MNNTIKRTWNQGSMVNIEDLRGMTFQAESGAHTFVISAVDSDGNAVSLSGTPSGTMLRSDNTDQALICSVSGGKVYATLPAGCYDVPGRAGITIFLTSGGQKVAIYAAVVSVTRTQSGTASPGTTASVVDLVNAIAAAVATIPASYTDLMSAMAPTYSSSGLYAVGSYAWYNGKLYRCTTAITSGETWTSGHWTLANLGSDLVDLKSALYQIAEIKENLLNNVEITNGNVSPGNGTVTPNENYRTTDFIQVEAGKRLVSSKNNQRCQMFTLAFYTEAKAVIRPGSSDTGDGKQYSSGWCEIPETAFYVRVTYELSDYSSSIILFQTERASGYIPDLLIKKDSMPGDVAVMQNVDFPNMLTGVTMYDGYYLKGDGTLAANASYISTDFMPVEVGKYVVSAYNETKRLEMFRICKYNGRKGVITQDSGSGDGTQSVSGYYMIPSDVVYVRATFRKTDYEAGTPILYQSDSNKYKAFGYKLKEENIPNTSPFFNKKVSWYGDSIMQNIWWKPVSDEYGMISTNNGVGGTKISGTDASSMCQESRINGEYSGVTDPNTGTVTYNGVAIPNDADFIIIGAGTNDWLQSVSMGQKNIQYNSSWEVVEDVTTFYQACHVMFRRLSELRPNARIIVLGTPFGFAVNRSAFTNKYGILNNQGLSSLDYGDALCDVAEMWGHTALRYGKIMDINSSNAATILDPSEPSGHLHPTTETAQKLFRKALKNVLSKVRY